MDLGKLMRQAQQMQEEMKKKQAELEKTLFEAEAAGGAVKVRMYGNYTLEGIQIEKDAIDPNDKEMLEDMIKAAVNEVLGQIKKATEKIAADMQSSMGGGF